MLENDPACMKFLNESQSLWKMARKLSDVLAEAEGFDAIFYVVGHGRTNPSVPCIFERHEKKLKLNQQFDLYSDPTPFL